MKRLRKGWALLLVFGCASGVACAQLDQAVCKDVPKVAIPQTDWPSLVEARALPSPCSPSGSYYSDKPGHFREARQCYLVLDGKVRGATEGQIQQLQSSVSGGATFPGDDYPPDTLTIIMVYANGAGVKRNPALARSLACEVGFTDGDQQKGAKMMLDAVGSGSFDLCKDGGFGRSVDYFCAGIEDNRLRKIIAARERQLDQQTEGHAAWQALKGAHQRFVTANTEAESAMCAGGTGCGVASLSYEGLLEREWADALANVNAGRAPAMDTKPAALTALGVDLNQTYKADHSAAEPCIGEACAEASQSKAQRAWMVYRDAWVAYGTARWPTVRAEQWRAWLTAQRLAEWAEE